MFDDESKVLKSISVSKIGCVQWFYKIDNEETWLWQNRYQNSKIEIIAFLKKYMNFYPTFDFSILRQAVNNGYSEILKCWNYVRLVFIKIRKNSNLWVWPVLKLI